MAQGGELDGVRILSAATVDAWGQVVAREPDLMMTELNAPRLLAGLTKAPVPRTVGYLGNSPIPGIGGRFGPNLAAFGAEGLGGQYGYCDRQSNIAVGFVRNDLAVLDVLQSTLTNVVYDCAHRLGHDVFVTPTPPRPRRYVNRALGAYVRSHVAVPRR
jgi:CubicO group peptidase (beta-lactamase class C family)